MEHYVIQCKEDLCVQDLIKARDSNDDFHLKINFSPTALVLALVHVSSLNLNSHSPSYCDKSFGKFPTYVHLQLPNLWILSGLFILFTTPNYSSSSSPLLNHVRILEVYGKSLLPFL